MARLRVTLAGALSLDNGQRHLGPHAFGGTQLPLVTAVLVLKRAAVVPVELLADELWPGGPPTRWRVAVRGLVSRLRRLLDEIGIGDDPIVATGGVYVVRLGDVEVDVETVPGDLERARKLLADGDVEAARRHANAARQVASRPVLPGIDAPALTELRAELADQRIEALGLLAECRNRVGERSAVVTVAQEAVSLDPFRERSWRQLLTAQAAAGDVVAALQSYQRMRSLFAVELGVDPSPETRQLHLDLLRRTQQDVAPAEAAVAAPAAKLADRDGRIPYRGLHAFGPEDADLFFGREVQVQELLDRLGRSNAAVVTGASGSGKSSLVRAGLLPAVAAGGLHEGDTWVTTVIMPGTHPLKALASALAELGDLDPDLAAQLWTADDPVGRAAHTILRARRAPAAARLLVVVDQAEELFTACEDEAERRRFVAVLLDAARGSDARACVVMTLRADFYGAATTLSDLAELLSTSQYALPPLDGDGYEAAVVGPARVVGAALEDGLVGRILAEVGREPGSLPLFQHALLELWHRRDGNRLTVAAFDDIGGVTGALAHRAETIYGELDPEERAVARWLLLRTINPGQGSGDTSRRVPLSELHHDPAGPTIVDDIVARLVEARLLTTTAPPGGTAVVELAHEALITGWPRLAGWIDDDRTDLVLHRRVADAAKRWNDSERHPDYLLGGQPLSEVTGIRDRAPELLDPLERAFLDASVAESRSVARRRTRQRRVAFVAMGLAVALAAALAVVSMNQRDEARAAEQRTRSLLLAEASRDQLDQDADLALLLALEAVDATGSDQPTPGAAVRALNQAIASHRVVQALPEGGVVVGFASEDRLVTTPNAVWDVDSATPAVELEQPPSQAIWDSAISPDGRLLASVYGPEESADRSLGATADTTIWDLASGRIVHRIPAADEVQDQPAFSPDGRLLAVVSYTFQPDEHPWQVSVHDLEDGGETQRITVEGQSFRTAFSLDGRLLAVADGLAPTVRLYDVRSGELVQELSRPGGGGFAAGVAFHPDGEHVAVLVRGLGVDVSAQVLWFAIGSDDPVMALPIEGSEPWNLCISGDGSTLAVLTPGERVEVFDLPAGTLRMALPGGVDGPPACSPDGELVAATNVEENRVMVWDVTGGGTPSAWSSLAAAPAWTGTWVAGGFVTTHADQTIRRWEDGVQVAATGPELPGQPPWGIVASPDQRYVVTNVAPPEGLADNPYPLLGDGRLLMRDARTLEVVRELRPGGWPMGFSPDSSRFLTGSFYDQEAVYVVDVATGEPSLEIGIPQVHPGANRPAATFLPDGRHAIIQQLDRGPIHDLETGEIVAAACPSGLGESVASPDGELLAVFNELASAVLVYDLRRLVALAASPDDCVRGEEHASDTAILARLPLRLSTGLAFSPDGRRLVTASGLTHDVNIWDPRSGELLLSLPHDGEVAGPSFTADGDGLALVHRDGGDRQWVRRYSLDVDELTRLAEGKVTRGLTADECHEYALRDDCAGLAEDSDQPDVASPE